MHIQMARLANYSVKVEFYCSYFESDIDFTRSYYLLNVLRLI